MTSDLLFSRYLKRALGSGTANGKRILHVTWSHSPHGDLFPAKHTLSGAKCLASLLRDVSPLLEIDHSKASVKYYYVILTGPAVFRSHTRFSHQKKCVKPSVEVSEDLCDINEAQL